MYFKGRGWCNVLGLVFFNNYNDYFKLDSLIMLRVGVNVTCLFVALFC